MWKAHNWCELMRVGVCVCVCVGGYSMCNKVSGSQKFREKSPEAEKTRKLHFQGLGHKMLLVLYFIFSCNGTVSALSPASASHDLRWRGKLCLPVAWCHLWIKHVWRRATVSSLLEWSHRFTEWRGGGGRKKMKTFCWAQRDLNASVISKSHHS